MKGPNAFIKRPERSFAPYHIIHRENIGADEQGHLPLLDKDMLALLSWAFSFCRSVRVYCELFASSRVHRILLLRSQMK